MAKAAKEKTEFTVAPQNDSAQGSWHTATAGMYTKEGLAELRNSQAFTPKPSGGRSRERMTRGGGGQGDADTSAAGSEQVFAGDEAEMVHEAGQQGDLKEVRWCRGGGAFAGYVQTTMASNDLLLYSWGVVCYHAGSDSVCCLLDALVPGYVCHLICCLWSCCYCWWW